MLLKNTTAGGTPLYALYRQQRLVVASEMATNPVLNVPTPSEVDQLNWGLGIPQVTVASLLPTQLAAYQAKISCKPNPNAGYSSTLYFNSPADLTIPQRRTGAKFPLQSLATSFQPIVDPTSTTGQLTGEDLVLQDVLSFDVKLLLPAGTGVAPLPLLPVGTVRPDGSVVKSTDSPANRTVPTTDFYGVPYFDTWSQRRDDLYNYDILATAPPFQASVLAVQITIRIWDPKTQITRQVTVVQEM